ncbi:hypothetical protein Tco_0684611 [Tanacetum coccineum]
MRMFPHNPERMVSIEIGEDVLQTLGESLEEYGIEILIWAHSMVDFYYGSGLEIMELQRAIKRIGEDFHGVCFTKRLALGSIKTMLEVSSDDSEVWICQILQENSQKRTRERMSDQEAKEIKAEAREIMPQPSTVNCS